MTEQAPHVFVATPMYGGLAHAKFIESCMMFMNAARDNGISVTFAFMGNESLITRARNALANGFLKSPCTHLFFVDADIGFRPMDAIRMVQADCDIIAGVYPKKDINWPQVARAVRDGVPDADLYHHTGDFVINVDNAPPGGFTVPTDKPFPVRNAGTGLMLIKRRVFEILKDHVPSYTNNMTTQNKSLKVEADKIHEYFATSIDPEHNVLLSEDYHFCQVWKKAGGEVHIAPWCDLTHNGTYEFSGHFARKPV
jgi:hypothetical protein